METLSFTVAEYQAPLDLILHLISKHKLNILDIDISSLLEQYMDTINSWKNQNLEVSSEFLEMASRLVYIKTVSLLPRHEEEHEKLRQDLTGQLVEYSICKQAAKTLGSLYIGQDLFVREPAPISFDPTYTLTHPASLLLSALADAMGRGARRLPPSQEVFEPLVNRPIVSVTTKIFTVLRALRVDGRVRVDRLYRMNTDRSGVIATFLALLELIKSGKVTLHRDQVELTSTSQKQEE
ncbi:MAG: segregation and condensation protein A [Oscillospiraceae bacterium]